MVAVVVVVAACAALLVLFLAVARRSSRGASRLIPPPSRLHLNSTGFEIEDHFVVGYGMDLAEEFRSLPCVCIMKTD